MKTTIALLLLAGCGGATKKESTVQFTCDVQTSMANTCSQLVVPASLSDDTKATCESTGGVVTFDDCTRPGSLGVCRNVDEGGVMATIYEYESQAYTTALGAQTACTDLGGTFEASLLLPMSCGIGSLCVEFPALTTDDEKSAAQSYCDQQSYGTLQTGSCAVSPLLGMCARTQLGIGEYDTYDQASIDSSASDQADECLQTGGTWTNA